MLDFTVTLNFDLFTAKLDMSQNAPMLKVNNIRSNTWGGGRSGFVCMLSVAIKIKCSPLWPIEADLLAI